jgi:8-oxo-dGTP pyrophosphatase MutT (NUDIX family)
MADELVDVIDEDDKVIGKELKSAVHEKGLRHRVSAVLLQGEDGIPTASKMKVEAGKLFHSAAGHIHSGETYQECAKRELLEETGIKAHSVELLGAFWLDKDYATRKEKERFEVYLAKYSPKMGRIRLNSEQIDERWLSKEEIKQIYGRQQDRISDPLRLTCRFILNL